MERSDDVLVVGGGPAGLTAASLLAGCGLSVSVLERELGPEGGVAVLTRSAVEILTAAGVETSRFESPAMKYKRLELRAARDAVGLHLGERSILAMHRTDLVDKLRDTASKRGARVLCGFRATRPEWEERRITGIRARDPDGKERLFGARAVVDASGAAMFIAGALGQAQPRTGPRREVLSGWEDGAPNPAEVLELWPGERWLVVGSGTPSPVIILERSQVHGGIRRAAASEFSLRQIRRIRGAGALTRAQAGEGWVAVGSAAGRAAPLAPGATGVGLETAAAAAWEIPLSLEKGRHLAASQVGATVTLARQAVHLESLLARGLEQASEGGWLQRAAATPFRRKHLTASLLGEWSPKRGRLAQTYYLWWLARGRARR